jgi:undecaprenyl-diphosphatase
VDTEWYLEVNQAAQHTPWLHALVAGYALWGGLTLLAMLLVAGWWRARSSRDACSAVAVSVSVGLATVISLLLNQQIISPLVTRERPCHVLHRVEVLLPCTADYSMPSDHGIVAGAFVVGLLLLSRKLGLSALPVALLLAFSRVYVGVHYPSDTVLGLVCGGVVALIVVLALRPALTRLARQVVRTRYAALVSSQP